MLENQYWLDASSSEPLFVYSWLPNNEPRAVLQIVHGLGEHAGRYSSFAQALCAIGIGVVAHDQRGHGQTGMKAVLGHYADDGGWELVISDITKVRKSIVSQVGAVPVYIFGHSMGSFITQGFLIRHSEFVAGAILCGSNYQSTWLYRLARAVVLAESVRLGRKGRSRLFYRLTFGEFSRAITPRRTELDWLSRDPSAVDNYRDDPLCGFLCSNQLWLDYLAGLIEISSLENLSKIGANLPIFIVGGSCDPVSDGSRLEDLTQAIVKAGNKNTTLKIYADARHSLLSELNREEVTTDLINWLESLLATRCSTSVRPTNGVFKK